MRQVHQGAQARRHAESPARACVDRRTRRGRRASRFEDLSEHAPLGAILAGGSGRRFGGSPKGLEVIGTRRIIDRVAHALRPSTSSLVLLANESDAPHWLPGVPVFGDRHHGAGGLAGVEVALSSGSDAVVVAWDMPFVNSALIQLLIAEARESDADVCLPDSASPHGFEPFCSYYSARVHEALCDFLDRGGGPARDFVRSVAKVRRIPLAQSRTVGDPDLLFFSVNAPEDLRRARAIAAGAQ